MSYMKEYINRKMSGEDLVNELLDLIGKYNAYRGKYLLVHASAISKPMIPDISLTMDDYYIIYDLLRDLDTKYLDFYLETPGGSGEAAEEIARFTREKFSQVNFVISGEAKSAGTILVLSGNEILMTRSGSLGPIDAQVKVGRSVVSAYDYCEWIEEKRKFAEKYSRLNPFDATMVAQISPGELMGVRNSLEFAKDLVVKWLPKYKFKEWKVTEERKLNVTDEMRKVRAREIAEELTNHATWRSHGRSIKINDLQGKLQIICIDDDPDLADIVYRIQTVIRIIFDTTTTYKIFATEKNKILKHAAPTFTKQPTIPQQSQKVDIIQIKIKCQNCGKEHCFFASFSSNPQMEEDFIRKGCHPFPGKTNKYVCECGFEHDLSGIRNQIETQMDRKIINGD